MSKRRQFQRPLGIRRYRKLFVIAVEGDKTEPQYFELFRNQNSIHIECLRSSNKSAPQQVLKRMDTHIKKYGLKKSDEAWLVVDKDQWTNEQLTQLLTWSKTKNNYGFALSNPKFEFWLLLHFEDGKGIDTSRQCSEQLN